MYISLWKHKNLMAVLLAALLSLGFIGCQQRSSEKSSDEKGSSESPVISSAETRAEVKEGDFAYRLVTEKAEYTENEPVKIYAELEYTGDQEEIEIYHAASPFYFPMVETSRNYEIGYAMEQPLLRTKLIKGEPLREEYRGSGGYSEEDAREYIDFMKKIIHHDFPEGNYVVLGHADFYILGDEEAEKEINYNIKAEVVFTVK
jgi:hypothetical protein